MTQKLKTKLVLVLVLAILGVAFSENVTANNASLQYVWNESCTTGNDLCWIPWLSTNTGEPKIFMDLLNITAKNISTVDSLLTDYIFPETNPVITIDNLTVIQDIFTAGKYYGDGSQLTGISSVVDLGNYATTNGSVEFTRDVNITGNLTTTTIQDVSNQGLVVALNFNNHSMIENKSLDSSGFSNHVSVNVGVEGLRHNATGGRNGGGALEMFAGGKNHPTFLNTQTQALFGDEFTIAFWANPGPKESKIIMFGDLGVTGLNSNSPLAFYGGGFNIGDGVGGYQLWGTVPNAPANKWTHYAFIDDGTNYLFYIDGKLNQSATISIDPGPATTERNFAIGYGFGDVFNGTIDDFRMYKRALSIDELDRLYVYQQKEPTPSFVSQRDVFVTKDGNVGIGDTDPAGTQGLTINQGAADDIIFTLKSSDVSHGLTADIGGITIEDDDYLTIRKGSATLGGVIIQATAEDAAIEQPLAFFVVGGTGSTTKTTGGRALSEFIVHEHDGSGNYGAVTADGNIFSVRANAGGSELTRFMIDEDGDRYISGTEKSFSDERIKTNFKQLPYGLNQVLTTNPKMFDRYQKYEFNNATGELEIGGDAPTMLGFTAQDVRKTMPLLVEGDEKTDVLTINEQWLTPVLWKAIQEQQKMIDDLQRQLDEVKSKQPQSP